MGSMDEKKKSILIIIVVCLFVGGIIGLIIGLSVNRNVELTPNGPNVIEDGATQITDDNIDNSNNQELENSASITFTKTIVIDSSTGIADLLFALPSSTDMDSVISIVINEETIIRSGRIMSGYQVNKLKLLDPNKPITKGTYNGTLIISFYAKDSNVESSVNTQVDVTVIVQ